MEAKHRDFVGYEYKEVITDFDKASFLIDGYENFGWEKDENIPGNDWEEAGKGPHSTDKLKLHIRLKRDRKIMNKMELTRLQRNFEACVNEIEKLEKSKTFAATMYAILIGLAGTAFMVGFLFAVTAEPRRTVLSVFLALPALAGWISPFFVFRRMAGKRTEEITPLIEAKYEEIYEICEKGNKLLN